MAANSRRKFIDGIETADEYSSGGSTPSRINSGSMWVDENTGRKLAPTPTATSRSGEAIPSFGPMMEDAAITANPATRTTSISVTWARLAHAGRFLGPGQCERSGGENWHRPRGDDANLPAAPNRSTGSRCTEAWAQRRRGWSV